MGMSTHVTGVRDLDGQFSKMIAVKLACESAGIDYPDDVENYFNGEPENSEADLRLNMAEVDIKTAVTKDNGREMENSFVVDLSKLPEEVKAIRFTNSY